MICAVIYCSAIRVFVFFFFFKQKTAYEMRISDWSSDVCSSDLTISFEELVALAFPQPPTGPQVCFTVSYRKGPPPRPEGSLLPGQSVHVIEGMTFHVTATDKS